MSKMRMILEHGSNPDIDGGGYWEEPTAEQREMAQVDSFLEAVRTFRTWITTNGLGGGNITPESGRLYSNETGELLARVSYNGRVWTPDAYPIAQPIDVMTPLDLLQQKFEATIGYDPIADNPGLSRDDVARILAEWKAAEVDEAETQRTCHASAIA